MINCYPGVVVLFTVNFPVQIFIREVIDVIQRFKLGYEYN